MITPQFFMSVMLTWATCCSFYQMVKNDKTNAQRIGSFIAAMLRAIAVISVLHWGEFW
jgi:hypothetical protein